MGFMRLSSISLLLGAFGIFFRRFTHRVAAKARNPHWRSNHSDLPKVKSPRRDLIKR
jgi:hypothetical protein